MVRLRVREKDKVSRSARNCNCELTELHTSNRIGFQRDLCPSRSLQLGRYQSVYHEDRASAILFGGRTKRIVSQGLPAKSQRTMRVLTYSCTINKVESDIGIIGRTGKLFSHGQPMMYIVTRKDSLQVEEGDDGNDAKVNLPSKLSFSCRVNIYPMSRPVIWRDVVELSSGGF